MDFQDIIIDKKEIIDMFRKSINLDRLSHAYLFNGKKGTSKFKTALYICAMLHCTSDNKPCLKCANCLNIINNNYVNLHILEKEGNSIKKDQILKLQEEFVKTPAINGKRVYIIKDIETMSVSALNSLLKFIEEPINQSTVGIMITNDIENVLPTILSRSVIINFKEINKEEFINMLINENITKEQAYIISNLTNNLDEAKLLKEDENILKLYQLLLEFLSINTSKDLVLFLLNNKKYFEASTNIVNFLELLIVIYEDLLKICYNLDGLSLKVYEELYEQFIKNYSQEEISLALQMILEFKNRLEFNVNSKNLLHQTLINIIK